IFDEPTRGVDVGAIVEIHQLISDLADNGMAVVVISSYLPEIMAVSDRILVVKRGRVVEEMMASDASEEKIMFAAVH
ncbi:MAG: sugar ABC transporter ATP-binding protein, partial [Rhizobium sp.]